MKKNALTIATAISAAFLLAACSQTELVDDISSAKINGTADNSAVAFSTYAAKQGTTRAVDQIATKDLQDKGFGVFAYHTAGVGEGENEGKYNAYRGNGKNVDNSTGGVANFMYNQKVEYKDQNGGYWTYDPLKYWPNDFAEDAVDNGTPAATGSGKNGYVSFFAYAPYTENTGDNMTQPNQPGDPRIKYEGGDLLWGTLDPETGGNVLGTANAGGTVDGGEGTVAIDLTKQKVGGKVKFNFKHAVAAIGGTKPGTGGGTDNVKSSFKVRLAIDDKNTGEASEKGDKGERRENQTVVTIKSIHIENSTIPASEVQGNDNVTDTEGTIGTLAASKWFNLATGKWEEDETGSAGTGSQAGRTVEKTIGYNENGGETIKLNSDIAEYQEGGTTPYFNNYSSNPKEYFTNHTGVTESLQSVYDESETPEPMYFIPGEQPVLKVTIEYVVRTYDEGMDGKCSTTTNKISKKIVFPKVDMNKHYSLVARLGLTSVKFDAQVEEWEKEGEGNNGPETDNDLGNGDKVEVGDFPANVE